MDDELYLCLKSWSFTGRLPDLGNPRTFNEKLQWLKLHDRNPLYITLVDKCAVKKWVADRIGTQHVTKTCACWECVEDVDVSRLPERFVLKTNHDCGGIAICRDRCTFDLDAAKKKLAGHLKRNYFWGGREWPYKNVKPRVFAEEYLEPDTSGSLSDYKVFCFDGVADCMMVCVGRETGNPRFYFVDREWRLKRYNVSSLDLPEGYAVPKPPNAELMFSLAEELSQDIPFVRVDFYDVSGRVLFGEMTFYPQSGFDSNILPDADLRWGGMLDIESVRQRLAEGGSK